MTEIENKNYPNVRQSFGIVGIIFLVMVLLGVPFIIIFQRFFDKDTLVLIIYSFAVGVSFWIVNSIRKRKIGISTFNFRIENKRIVPLVIIASTALLFGIVVPIEGLVVALFPIPAILNTPTIPDFSTFLMIVIAAPVLEELIFRGIMLDGLLKIFSPAKAILISSALFMLTHFDPWQFVSAFLGGVFYGWVYYRTKTVSFTIIMHAAAYLSNLLVKIG